ncbi:adenosylcobinamide-GDP ribazoletransferase [Psychromonas sp.]|uniref:adenosylcobinamide-GDP ribazoletransferase n=1 Tax=Psychromonas sp. TaxID=1884585 RepID=UPI0035615CE5
MPGWSQYRQYAQYQLQLFLLALGFFSRIPVSNKLPYSSERMNKAGRYFALVGLLLGALCGLLFIALSQLFSSDIAIFLTILFSLLLTGCFHEDGLTDMADGIGGGMTTERRLTIMKDSRIGTYGASALFMTLLGKFLLLSELSEGLLAGAFMSLSPWTENNPLAGVFCIWIIAYTLSRAVAATLIFDMPYVSDPQGSKSKPLAARQSLGELIFIILSALLPCLLLKLPILCALIICAFIFRTLFKNWLLARLAGFTGDCLGAAQQLMELLTYLLLLALLNPASAVAIG